ncbi:MAG: hypothetical protein QGG40_01865 [Myxococcota bacterium]|nr:hypothetical protein [Myxococcota bacterium]
MRSRALTAGAAGGLLALGALADAWTLRWVSDDAFISFRYARNLLNGHGLVYNIGEYVEGYTNFLWTLVVAVGMAMGADAVHVGHTISLACYAAILAVLVRESWRRAVLQDQAFVPLAATAWALHLHARQFATSGLETSLFTLLVLVTILQAREVTTPRQARWVGLWGALATLTRPEGALFYGLAGLAVLVPGRSDTDHDKPPGLPTALNMAMPGAVLLLPWLAWKLATYGELLPNTWYAKSGETSWWSQGGYYLGLYFQAYWPVALGLVCWPLLAARRHAGWLPWVASVAFLLHVARVGGDFMFARFALPVTPLLLLGVEQAIAGLTRPSLRIGLATLAAAGVLVAKAPIELEGMGRLQGIAEERNFYPASALEDARRDGAYLAELFEDTDARVIIYGGQAMLAYYADFPLAIEGATGLTDRTIARLPVAERSYIGHDKDAPLEYLLERGVRFRLAWRTGMEPHEPWTEIDFGQGLDGYILSWDETLMKTLQERGADFVDFPDSLDASAFKLPDLDRDTVQNLHTRFHDYYFAHNEDPAREKPYLDRLSDSDTPGVTAEEAAEARSEEPP